MQHTEDTLAGLCKRVTYPGLLLEVGHRGVGLWLRWACPEGTCNVSGTPLPWKGRKWLLSKHMTDGEVVWTALKALLTALEHEARERFKFDGVPIADSHVDIDALVRFHRGHSPVMRAEVPAA